MTTLTHNSSKRLTTEQISTRALYVLVALVVVLFNAFFLIGYDEPYSEDSQFNAPLMTDAVLVFIYLLVFATSALTVAAMVVALRRRDKSSAVVNGIHAARITRAVVGLLLASLIVTYVCGSTSPVTVNGEEYTDSFWLKTTDMFINTSLVLLATAVGCVIYGLSGYNRKVRRK